MSPYGRRCAVGRHAAELTVIATVVRDGQPTAPEAGLRLRPGDEVLLVAHEATERDVQSASQ